MQGKSIPKFFDKILYDPETVPAAIAPFFEVPGILIKYIEGHCLDDFEEAIQQAYWQDIYNQGVKLVHRISDLGVLNRSGRLVNAFIREKPGTSSENIGNVQYKVVMIDFGRARLRRHNETDYEWGKAKYHQNEERRIGKVMQDRAERYQVNILWERSRRWQGGIWKWEDYAG